MKSMVVRILWICFLVWAGWSCLFADEVILLNGNCIKGIITLQDSQQVKILTAGGELTLSKARIQTISNGSPAEDALLTAEIKATNGQLNDAVNAYQSALKEGIPAKQVRQSLLEQQGRFLSRTAHLAAQEREALVQFLGHLLSESAAQDNDFLFLCGQLFFDLGDREQTFACFAKIPQTYYQKNEIKKEFVLSVLHHEVKSLVAEERFEDAIRKIELISMIDTTAGSSSSMLLYLYWGAAERDKGKFKEALQLYVDRLLPISPVLAKNRICYVLEQAAREARRSHQYPDAIDLFRIYGMKYCQADCTGPYADLLEEYGQWLLNEGRTGDARNIFQEFYSLRPSDKNRRYLALCDYAEEAAALTSDDYYGHYQLGKKCLERDLLAEAAKEFSLAREAPELKETADMHLEVLEEKNDLACLKEAHDLYNEAHYFDAMEHLTPLLKPEKKSALESDAKKLAELCRTALENESSLRPYQAEIYLQQAERSYFSGDYKETIAKLNRILSEYSDTPAASRAQRLTNQLINQIQLARLEGKESPQLSTLGELPIPALNQEDDLKEEIARIVRAFHSD
jgi:hypothetical protein